MTRETGRERACEAPVARIEVQRRELHGVTLEDPYRWIEEREDPEVLAHIERENEHAHAALAHTEGLREEIYQELMARVDPEEDGPHYRHGDYSYYTRGVEGRPQRLICRKLEGVEAPEEVLLDMNAEAEGREYCRLIDWRVSPDHRYLAYEIDGRGDELFTLIVRDMESGGAVVDSVSNAQCAVFTRDSGTLYYCRRGREQRTNEVWRHHLGQPPENDRLVYEEHAPSFFVQLKRARTGDFLFIRSADKHTSEVRSIDARVRDAEPMLVLEREQGVRYEVEHDGGESFLLLTNRNAPNFKVVSVPITTPGASQETLVEHREEVHIDSCCCFAGYIVLIERRRGLQRIRVVERATGAQRLADFPDASYGLMESKNLEYAADYFRFSYASFRTPGAIYHYHFASGALELVRERPLRGGFDRELYRVERIHATAGDGVQIPISLVQRKDGGSGAARRARPFLLVAYGCYGTCFYAHFDPSIQSLLDRGLGYAIAHVRGGGEMGSGWHEQGRLLNKRNSFDDFIACAQALIGQGFATPGRLAIQGESAGGGLVGSVLNMRPDLFRCAVASVPAVDTLNRLLNLEHRSTPYHHGELGDPRIPEHFHYIRSWAAYENVTAQEYPDLLVTAGFHDPRVDYHGPVKWVAKLRAMKTDQNLLVLRVSMDSGHFGASGREKSMRENAVRLSFLLERLGCDSSESRTATANA